ncbi:carbonic anhydrase [Cryptosporangium sp. NPDC051539]|uniref:carbonic anhydrase n=1 Tax=Cryptosporangium sp. NPDC051539 TaxID=3363962 RepID=UPI0037AC130A
MRSEISRAGLLWAMLRDGNVRWTEGRSTADSHRGAARRSETRAAQAPFAVVLGCSDSRVPAEILFDQGLGDLFVIRTAGHVVDAAALGSIEYAVEFLGTELIVVLGHDECGAVATATDFLDGGHIPPGHIRDVAEWIAPHIVRARVAGASTNADVCSQHSHYTAELLAARSPVVNAMVRRGGSVVAALYSLSSGKVSEAHPLIERDKTPGDLHYHQALAGFERVVEHGLRGGRRHWPAS